MEYDRRPREPEIDLSVILPTHKDLVSVYADYLGLLGAAIDSRERTEELQAQIRGLLNPDYAGRIPESAQAEELALISERIENIAPATHIFSLQDITPIRQLAARNLKESEPDQLFSKLCAFEKALSRNTETFGGSRYLEAISISELQQHSDDDLEALTEMEFKCCVSFTRTAREEAITAAERKLNSREGNVTERAAALLKEIGKQPVLQAALEHQASIVRPKLAAFNVWALRSYQGSELTHREISATSEPYIIRPYLEWRYRILCDLDDATRTGHVLSRTDQTASLEGLLGGRSGVNHFDVFLLPRQGSLEFYTHFHQPINMQIFLALANPSCDAVVFQGAEGNLSRSRLSRGADFVVPAVGGIVEIPEVVSSLRSRGIR